MAFRGALAGNTGSGLKARPHPGVRSSDLTPHSARRGRCQLAAALALAALHPTIAHAQPHTSGPIPTQLWWRDTDGLHRTIDRAGAGAAVAPVPVAQDAGAQPPPADRRVPLGSVWKLFAYAWLESRGAQEPVYRCAAARPATDDEYCCEPGGSVGRDEALARSCGPYFAPRRLQVDAAEWARFWRANGAPAWLASPAAFEPGTEVDVAALLDALRAVPVPARQAARRALLPVALRIPGVVAALGSGPRFKTWSWTVRGEHAGGAAGWLADGTPFWFGAAGTSRHALGERAAWLAAALQSAGLQERAPEPAAIESQPCVAVDLFARYPIARITRPDGLAAVPGTITGPHRIAFANGHVLAIDASPGLQLQRGPDGAPTLAARWPLEDYVARVVDREGDGTQAAAARALAVAARSYLLQNAALDQGCRRIADDSRTQRVSPDPPTRAARDAAAFTADLVLDGPPVHYHRDRAGDAQMAWGAAVESARAGAGFEAILAQAYPRSRLVAFDAAGDCTPLPEARAWLLASQQRWRETLRREPGFEPLPEELQVCRLAFGPPNSDQRLLQIRVREGFGADARVTLVHEYLHLAFRHHPNGRNEDFVERLARQLIES
jgi:uncharacterized protein YfaQ (DUF2300 family)